MDKLRIEVDLTHEEAWALAEFLKRVQPMDYERRAGDPAEARLMYDAGISISSSLRKIGISPR